MSWSEKNELWARWRRGESLRDTVRSLPRVSALFRTRSGLKVELLRDHAGGPGWR